jgi:hypothetical protein
MPVRLAPVVETRDRFLAHVATLGERHRALVEAGLLGDHGVVEVDPVAGPASLDAPCLGRLVGHGDRAAALQGRAQIVGARGLAQHVDPGVRDDHSDGDAVELHGPV